MVQDGCLSSSHSDYIPSARKERTIVFPYLPLTTTQLQLDLTTEEVGKDSFHSLGHPYAQLNLGVPVLKEEENG